MDVTLGCRSEQKDASVEGKSRRIAILGGGIAGLSAAWALEKARRAGEPVKYSLYEAADRLGGVISSELIDGCVVEGGPDSFLTEKPAAAELCRELGIGDQLLGSNDAERKTYILVGERLIPLPDGLMFMVPTKLVPTALTPLFSWSTKLHMAREFLFPPAPATEDESVADMTRRHFGQETVDRLVSPLLSGVYGGDASQLSVRAVLPRMVSMEQKHRSLSRAMLAARKTAIPPTGKSRTPRSLFTTLRGGMSQMVEAIARELQPGSIHLGTSVRALRHNSEDCPSSRPDCKLTCGWTIETAQGIEPFDGVILALPAWVAGGLLRGVDRLLGDVLAEVPYSSSITVTMGFPMDQLHSLPPGFGYLVPATERRSMLACTFVHAKFAGRTPPDKGVLRCFLGGAGNDALLDEPDDRIREKVLKELAEILHVTAPPTFVRIARSRRAMAQYSVGHLDRMQYVRDSVAAMPSLAVAGNAYEGIGVPDCIRTGQHAAHSVLESVQQQPAAKPC
ncbi:MAG TPA: protoporphyrinogen oxidase [Acidobacteriaceae bacterium]|jgi:oxygen-dependent protoporphyrinogen oxidase|nr:protoporphyrinogen oxidase [Acidobacteriaceae bacterium]